MSISPTDANRPIPSSLRSLSPNPSSDHGRRRRRPRRPLDIPDTGSAAAGGRRENSASLVSLAGDFFEEPQSMADLRRAPESGKDIDSPQTGVYAQHPLAVREGTSSRTRSVQNRIVQSDLASSVHCHQLNADSRGPLGNTSHSGSRKNQLVNANHLLNFQYDPIQRPQPRLPPIKKQQKVRPFNRDLFLQANYKFVVLDTGNYVVDLMDPDKMLQWEDIVCMKYSTPSPIQCPICLETPLCSQITSCGHIYCFPCILRYLLMGDEDYRGEYWKKCPLCFMMISLKDLYTVSIENVKKFDVGDNVYFALMTRPKNSFVPSRVDLSDADPTFCENELLSSFSKFTLTSDVELSVREAKSNLNDWLARAESGLVDDLERLPYVCAALEQLDQRMKAWAEHRVLSSSLMESDRVANGGSSANLGSAYSKRSKGQNVGGPTGQKIETIRSCRSNFGEQSPQDSSGSNRMPEIEIPEKQLSPDKEEKCETSPSRCRNTGEKDAYVFYQVTDGQHIILHPLNMKCLLHHYKSSDLLPSRISGKILQLETVTQSEASRWRYRFLSHFSLTTSFQLCEIDLRELLPADAFTPFLDEIKKRERQRKQVARKERGSKVQRDGAISHQGTLIPVWKQVSDNGPSFALDDFEALGNCTTSSTSPPLTGEKKSFSVVTRLGFAAAHDSPSLNTDAPADFPTTPEDRVTSSPGPSTSAISFASILAETKTPTCQDASNVNTTEKKGRKKPTRVLLSTAGGRRY